MKRNKGFVLIELLAAVAVLIASFAIVSPAASNIKNGLDQTGADAAAKTIYIRAQEKLNKLNSSGNNSILQSGTEMEYTPNGYEGNSPLRYISSDDENAEYFYDEKTDGKWIVEFNPVVGQVYGVFFSTGELDQYKGTNNDETLRHMSSDSRLEFSQKNGYNISYYGGQLEVIEPTTVTVEDEPTDPDKGSSFDDGFCYFEIYEDDGNISTKEYGIYMRNPEVNTLQDRVVVGDGYGVICAKPADASKVTITGTKTINLTDCRKVYLGFTTIYAFPTSWMCAAWLDNTAITKTNPTRESKFNQDYYWSVTVNYNGSRTNESYSYSPYYAKSMVAPTSSKVLPSTVEIRSARQLNNLSWMYSSYFNKKWAWSWTEDRVVKTTFAQTTDIDYDEYQFSTYTGREFVGQLPIGTDWGRFISTYDGKGHTVYNCELLRRNTTGNESSYAGLFGYVSVGGIKNLTVDGSSISKADYCGILAAYVQNATIENCTVKNSSITFEQHSTYNQTTGGNEWANARVGCLIGYVKCPEEDNSSYKTLINNCKVMNCTITAPDYMQTTSYYRQYQIGGLIGAAANFESNESRANHITISNCSVQATISTKSYGKGSNYCYVGGFAGAIKKYVVLSNNTYSITDANSSKHYADYYKS